MSSSVKSLYSSEPRTDGVVTARTQNSGSPSDLENSPNLSSTYADPFSLRSGKVAEDDLQELRKRRGKGKKVAKRVAEYQSRQNEFIDYVLKPVSTHAADAKAEGDAARLPVKLAIWISLIANVGLSGLQLYAAISSGSLSFLATAIDSVFDPGSNVILFWMHKKSQKLDVTKWPVGGSRLETVGNIVYGSFMAAANLVVVVEAIRNIATHSGDDLNEFVVTAVIAVGIALGVKLMLFLYCFTIRKHSSQVQVLWEDHRNDLFINGFGLLMSAGGSKWAWFLDPMGGAIIASGTIIAWITTIYGEFSLLTGKSAPHEFIQLVVYTAMTHSEDIKGVDTVRAYHSGPSYFVEVDIVMDPNAPLKQCHDVSQQLQDAIEDLPNVERAFVHVDYETSHLPEHRKKV